MNLNNIRILLVKKKYVLGVRGQEMSAINVSGLPIHCDLESNSEIPFMTTV